MDAQPRGEGHLPATRAQSRVFHQLTKIKG